MNSLKLKETNDKKECKIEIPVKRSLDPVEKKKPFILCNKRGEGRSDIYLSKPLDRCLRYASEKPASSKVFKKDSLLLPYRTFAINKRKQYVKQRSIVPVHKKYKIIAADFCKRLYVDREPDDVVTITKLDEEFFSAVQTHPYRKAFYKTIKNDFGTLLRIKQEIGYRNDHILKIEWDYKRELHEYETSVKNFSKQIRYFDAFIAQDYQKSMVILKEAEILQSQVQNMHIKLLNLANEQFLIMSSLISLNYKYGVQQKYGRFLYYVSPSNWRADHRDFAQSIDIETLGFDLTLESEQDTFAVMFEKLQIMFMQKPVKPVLYFEKPNDLINLFEDIANQQLWTMIRASAVSHNVPRLKAHVEKAKEDILKDTAALSSFIYTFKGIHSSLEEKVCHLKSKFYKILHGIFYESVGSPKVLKLLIDLQFYYEMVFKDLPVNFDMLTMAKAIEWSLFRHIQNLEALQSSTVHKAVKEATLSEERKFKMANIARQNLWRFELMAKKLLLSFSPVFKKSGLTPKERSELPKVYKTSSTSKSVLHKHYELTEAEIEYLNLFTDWTANQDPSEYLLNMKQSD